jgi:hypothetical protein
MDSSLSKRAAVSRMLSWLRAANVLWRDIYGFAAGEFFLLVCINISLFDYMYVYANLSECEVLNYIQNRSELMYNGVRLCRSYEVMSSCLMDPPSPQWRHYKKWTYTYPPSYFSLKSISKGLDPCRSKNLSFFKGHVTFIFQPLLVISRSIDFKRDKCPFPIVR